MEPLKLVDQKKEKKSPEADEFIIAIGASAGGIGAIHTLFDHTPSDAVAYVVIQHLSPDHKSFMAELLEKHSKLKIFVAVHDMEVKSNCIYVMPEGKNMTIAGGRLMLKDREVSMPNTAIDIFFNALAEDQKNKSIAVVLSGKGSDGTKGVAAIKKAGGMVIVQDPSSAEYESMPSHVIESGNYDYILSPKLIPHQIAKYIKQITLNNYFSDPLNANDEAALLEIIALIKTHTPLDFTDYKRPTIIRRITRRMMALDSNSIESYINVLKSDPGEIETLSKEFLINVTRFFRDPVAFRTIEAKVIPELVASKMMMETLKVWVIGCATGEEAYSIAILIKEYLIECKKDLNVKIFASDIDKDALAKAFKGVYAESISEDVSAKRLGDFFMKEGNEYKVRENIRSMIIFADHDVVHQPPYGKIDMIICRNLLIYFNPSLQKKIFNTINFCLNTNGYLFLGPSEGLGSMKNVFQEIDKKWKIYKNIDQRSKSVTGLYQTPQSVLKTNSYATPSSKPTKSRPLEQYAELIVQSHLEETGFTAGVCLDAHNNVLQAFGDYSAFLLPRLFNNNILELLPIELSIAVGASIKEATSLSDKVSLRGIKYVFEEKVCMSRILVKSVEHTHQPLKAMFVYFAEEKDVAVVQDVEEVFDFETHTRKYLSEVEKELVSLKMQLQEAEFDLEASSDNIQSYNEELISGNEEMQSSNEELQSINEELTTVNNEYQSKIKELAELNDDFSNYFRSSYNSQLYVDKNLIIKRFSPISMLQINIKESDIGRPLSDLSTNIKYPDLIEDIVAVIDTQVLKEKQIETIDGRWYVVTIIPYIKATDGENDGAILTFNDITDLKTSKQIIESANNKLVKINQDHDTFIYSVSHDLKAPLQNMEGLLSLFAETDSIEQINIMKAPLTQSVVRLKETISELADISKIETEIGEASLVNIEELLTEVKESIAEVLLESEADLEVHLDVREIKFSKKNLRSILLNLLSNAVKYHSPERSLEIVIKSYRSDSFVILSVQDNGLGIAKEERGKVFSKFKRVHNLGNEVAGTGIGLYLVKKLITNAGGKIEVESKYGSGSCFKAYFVA